LKLTDSEALRIRIESYRRNTTKRKRYQLKPTNIWLCLWFMAKQ